MFKRIKIMVLLILILAFLLFVLEESEAESITREVESDPIEIVMSEPIEVIALINDEAEESIYEPELLYLGEFEITAYEWTGYTCANGNWPTEGYTVACNSLPLGTEVYIEGVGYRTVEDRGASWHLDNWMDIYLGDEDVCNEWGVCNRDVYIVK